MSIYERLYLRLSRTFSFWVASIIFKIIRIRFGKNLTLFGVPVIYKYRGSEINLGDRIVLCSINMGTALGVNHPVILRTLAVDSRIIIGDDVGISGGTICALGKIEIGNATMLGANVLIVDNDFHNPSLMERRYMNDMKQVMAKPVNIGRNVFVGANSIVLKGVTIGDNSVIGAGSVVTRDIPANTIAAGNPCRALRSLNE